MLSTYRYLCQRVDEASRLAGGGGGGVGGGGGGGGGGGRPKKTHDAK